MEDLANTMGPWLATEQIGITGRNEIGAQFHHTMESQSTFCLPNDEGGLDMYGSTYYSKALEQKTSENYIF